MMGYFNDYSTVWFLGHDARVLPAPRPLAVDARPARQAPKRATHCAGKGTKRAHVVLCDL